MPPTNSALHLVRAAFEAGTMFGIVTGVVWAIVSPLAYRLLGFALGFGRRALSAGRGLARW